MEIRPASPDDGDDTDDTDTDDIAPAEPLTSAQWRVDRAMVIAKIVGIAVFAVLPSVFGLNLTSRWIGWVAAAGLVLYVIRDLIAPIRLAADSDGVRVVTGFAGHREIPWPEVERMRIDKRRRSGFLEIETADTLHLLSRYDLSMLPPAALEMLERIRPS